MFICSISQSPTASPVVSLKSHAIFDERALSMYVNSYGIDPISKDPMSLDDIIKITPTIPVSTITSNQIPQQTSIPTMLQTFQDAWDSLSLELFQLRSNLDQTRKELSLALYKQDAAIRVALKATKEKDELLKALAELGSSSQKQPEILSTSTNEKTNKIDIIEFNSKLEQTQQTLFNKHKIENKQNKALCPVKSNDFKLSLSQKDQIFISDIPSGIDKFLLDESRKLSLIKRENGLIEILEQINGSIELKLKYDSTIGFPFWLQSNPYIVSLTTKKRKGRQTKKSKSEPQPLNLNLINLSSSEDKENIPIDLEARENEIINVISHPSLPVFIILKKNEFVVCQFSESQVDIVYRDFLESSITAGAIHPDGILFARALDENAIEIFDISTREVKLTIDPPESENGEIDLIKSVQFASNGYSIVIEYEKTISVYDLRKATFQSILEKPQGATGISIDEFSTLILCGSKYSMYDKKSKNWLEFTEFSTDTSISSSWFQLYDRKYLIVSGKPTGVEFGVC